MKIDHSRERNCYIRYRTNSSILYIRLHHKKIEENKKKNFTSEYISQLVKNDSEKTFVTKFCEWTEQINSGHKIPSDNFFLFVRSCNFV